MDRDGFVYEGQLDISKEGRNRTLTGFVFNQAFNTVFLNISEEDPPSNSLPRTWKKGNYKISKFLNLTSLAVSIPLDSLSIEVVGFPGFLVAR